MSPSCQNEVTTTLFSEPSLSDAYPSFTSRSAIFLETRSSRFIRPWRYSSAYAQPDDGLRRGLRDFRAYRCDGAGDLMPEDCRRRDEARVSVLNPGHISRPNRTADA